ncbi:MAG: DNA (cytosine-5)-methyltransferase 1, partial [Francisella sp.]
MKKLNVIDLFSGCGGFSYGFEKEGYDIKLGVDSAAAALSTFKFNHKNSNILNLDLSRDESIQDIASQYPRVDVIMGGPPCQGFSLTGTRNEDDPRNALSKALFKLAELLNPKAIVIENVPSLLTLYNGKAKDQIVKMCHDLGYTVNYKILYAPDFGIPQIRKRVFFVALKKELGMFEFPKPILGKYDYISTSDAISDLPSLVGRLGSDESEYEQNPKTKYQKIMR